MKESDSDISNTIKELERLSQQGGITGAFVSSKGLIDGDFDFILEHVSDEYKFELLKTLVDDMSVQGGYDDHASSYGIKKLITECAEVACAIKRGEKSLGESESMNSIVLPKHAHESGKLLDFMIHFFSDDDQVWSLFNDINLTHYSQLRSPIINLYENLFTGIAELEYAKADNFNEDKWIRKESILSTCGSRSFRDEAHNQHAFLGIFKAQINAQTVTDSRTDCFEKIAPIIKERLHCSAKDLVAMLESGTKTALEFAGDRNTNIGAWPMAGKMCDLMDVIIEHRFSDDFKALVANKMLQSFCNGTNASVDHGKASHFIEMVDPFVEWEKSIKKMSMKGRSFLFSITKNPEKFNGLLDKKTRGLLLREEMSI